MISYAVLLRNHLRFIRALLYLAVVGVELMDLGMHFDSFGSLCDTVLGLRVSIWIDVELAQEGLEVALVLYE